MVRSNGNSYVTMWTRSRTAYSRAKGMASPKTDINKKSPAGELPNDYMVILVLVAPCRKVRFEILKL